MCCHRPVCSRGVCSTEVPLVHHRANTLYVTSPSPPHHHHSPQVTASSPYYNVLWSSGHTKGPDLQGMQPFQRINHFARSFELTRKDRLSRNVQRMQETKGAKHFNIVPKTFLLPEEYARFSACHLKERGVWIIKPVASSRGRGIYLINTVSVCLCV